jgi:hypothetical protein
MLKRNCILKAGAMAGRSMEELREELSRLMQEHIESVTAETFLGRLDEEAVLQQEERLKRIREVSAAFIAALRRSAA